jgi:hypothetical protein
MMWDVDGAIRTTYYLPIDTSFGWRSSGFNDRQTKWNKCSLFVCPSKAFGMRISGTKTDRRIC